MDKGPGPPSGQIEQGQVEQFPHRLVCGESAFGLDDLAQAPVHGFDGIGSVDDFPDLLWEGEERGQMVPVSAPQPADSGILLIPVFCEAIKRGLGLLQGSGLVYRPEILGHLLTVLPGDVGQAVTHHVYDAELHLGPGIHRLYGLRKARQTVAAGDEDITNASVLQFGEHVEPEFCPFVLLDPETQEFLVAVEVDAQGQVDRLVPYAAAT